MLSVRHSLCYPGVWLIVSRAPFRIIGRYTSKAEALAAKKEASK